MAAFAALRRAWISAGAGYRQVAQVIATSPVEKGLPLEELSQLVQEPTFAELGLGGYSPVGLIMRILESFHLDLGLPWWGAIMAEQRVWRGRDYKRGSRHAMGNTPACLRSPLTAASTSGFLSMCIPQGTVLARCLIFPLIVKSQREAILLNNHFPQINEMNTRLTAARKSGNQKQFLKAYMDLNQYQKAHNINPKLGFIAPLVQAPIFISFFFALRQMAEFPVPSMETGGLWWFLDLTAPDPYYVLPLMTTATMWAVLELGAESGVSNPNFRIMKTVFRVIPVILLPITINFPTAIFTYWMTSNLYSVAQVLLLRSPTIRTFFRIPKQEIHNPATVPDQKGLIDTVRKGWQDIQAGRRLQERENRIKHHLDLAATGPLRQTFSQNPLKHQQPSPSEPPPKKRPWEDTLG